MWLKVIIVILFFSNILMQAIAFYTLMQDQGKTGKRTANMLFIRVSLAILLLAFVIYGAISGDLNISSPWYNAPD